MNFDKIRKLAKMFLLQPSSYALRSHLVVVNVRALVANFRDTVFGWPAIYYRPEFQHSQLSIIRNTEHIRASKLIIQSAK